MKNQSLYKPRQTKQEKQRSLIVAAAKREINRRSAAIERLQSLDPEITNRAIQAIGSVNRAAEWLICKSHGLDGKLPVEFAATPDGRAEVLNLLGRIHYGIF